MLRHAYTKRDVCARLGDGAMDPRVVEFIEKVARTIIGLDVALFYQGNPRTFDTAAGIALRTHRDVDEVSEVLERMCRHGYLEAFTRGDGRYTCYALPKDPKVWNLLCLTSEAYLDHSDSRKEIVKILIVNQHRSSLATQDGIAGDEGP